MELVVTRLKVVKHGPVARQLRVAKSRLRKKGRDPRSVLATVKWGFLGLGKA